MVAVIFSNDDSQKPLSWQQVAAGQPSCSPDPRSDLPVTWSDTSFKVNYLSGLWESARLESDRGRGASLRVSEMSRVLILMARFFRSESSSRTRTCPSKWNPKSLEIAWSCWIAKWLVIVLETCKYASMQVCKYWSLQGHMYVSMQFESIQVCSNTILQACKYAIWQFGNYVSMQAC